MIRLAMTRVEEGGREEPVAISVRGRLEGSAVSVGLLRLKNKAGTEPQVSGPTKVAMAERPGCK